LSNKINTYVIDIEQPMQAYFILPEFRADDKESLK
jgi:hypothetical protein